jgi:hypothetical protein
MLLRSYLDKCGHTQHLIGNVLIEIGGDTATSRAYVADTHLGIDGAAARIGDIDLACW